MTRLSSDAGVLRVLVSAMAISRSGGAPCGSNVSLVPANRNGRELPEAHGCVMRESRVCREQSLTSLYAYLSPGSGHVRRFRPESVTRRWERRVIVISIIFIVFGLGIIPMSLSAFRSGQPIALFSHDRPIYGWEGFLTTICAELAGVGGIWGVMRKRRRG